MEVAVVQDRLMGLDELDTAYQDRGLYFGDGVYEVLRSYGGRLFALQEHMDRFARSVSAIGIEGVDIGWVQSQVIRAFNASGLEDARIYFHVTRGWGPRELYGPRIQGPTFLLTVTAIEDARAQKEQGIKVSTYPDLRWRRCDIKSLNLLPNVMARRDAMAKGCQEAILVDNLGMITEGAASAFFGVFQSKTGQYFLQTAPLTANILPSVTRAYVMRAAQELGIQVVERQFSPEQAKSAKELIMAVTTKDVVPIVQFDGCRVGDGSPGHITLRLAEQFRRFTHQAC